MAAVLRAYSVWLVFFSFLGGGVWGVCHHIPEVLCSHIHTNSVGQSKHIPWEFIVVNYCMPKLSIIQYRLGSLALLMQAGLWQLGIVVMHEIWGWALLWRLAGALNYSAKKIGHKKKNKQITMLYVVDAFSLKRGWVFGSCNADSKCQAERFRFEQNHITQRTWMWTVYNSSGKSVGRQLCKQTLWNCNLWWDWAIALAME